MWVRNADARGTEAVKLSVKWLAGLAVLALAIVAVVGASSTTKAAVGVIYVANTGQLTTTEPGLNFTDDGEDSVTNVWSTYAADIAGGQPLRLIDSDTDAQANTAGDGVDADLVRVIIIDADYDIATIEEVDPTDTVDLSAVFANSSVAIPGAGAFPVSGAIEDIELFLDDGAGSPDGVIDGDETIIGGPNATTVQATVIAVNQAGDTIQVRSEVSTGSGTADILVRYNSSQVDTLEFGVDPDGAGPLVDPEVLARSDLGSGSAQGLFLTETGRSTGRFEGFVRLTDADGITNDGLAEAAATGSTFGTAAIVRAASGPVVIEYIDSDGANRTANVLIDTSAPVPTVTGPADGFATQNQQPTFSGTVSESGSGLDISEVDLVIDEGAEAPNTNLVAVINDNGTTNLAGDLQDVAKTGAADGDFSFSFTHTPIALPVGAGASPDHLVDFQIRSEDLAGNFGFSDSDNDLGPNVDNDGLGVTIAGDHVGNGSFDAHEVKIDRVAPSILTGVSTPTVANGDHKTGVGLDAAGDEEDDSKSLRVRFNDNVENATASDFTVEFPSVSAILAPVSVRVDDANVYLTLAQDIPADERPIVRIQGTIEDAAGNGTAFGTANVSDGIAPDIGFSLSGGSGTGTGDEGPAELTKDTITITITSDEALTAPPGVTVFEDIAGTPTADDTGTALSSGTNLWTFTFTSVSGTPGDRRVVVTGSDRATSPDGTTLLSDSNNAGTAGANDESSFLLDNGIPSPVITPTTETSQVRPFIVIDYGANGETSAVVIDEILLDDVDVTNDLVESSDSTKFFIVPTSDLAQGEHTVEIKATEATDAAGNTSGAETQTFEIIERGEFERPLFAGWNAVSFPSDPLDPDINSVFTNAGHDAVLGFDPSVPGQWRVSVRDTVSGLLEPATESGLTSVRSTQAYWVHSNNFERVEVLLVGEVLPGAGSPPGIVTIPTVLGFNAVPIVDTSRALTTGASGAALLRNIPTGGGGTSAVTVASYLGGVDEGRVYKWNPEILSFELLAPTDGVFTGDVLFVEVTGTPVPIFP